MNCREKCCVQKVLTDGLHVKVHEGGGEGGPAEQYRGFLFPLDLEAAQRGQQVRLLLLKPAFKNNRIER